MKAGVVTSVGLHAAALIWGLWSLAPAPLEVRNVESLPVELVPMEEFSQAVTGEKDAPVTDTPAPKPTQKPQTLPMPAQNVGDNETDLATPPTPVERPKPTEQAAAAKPTPPPAPEPDPQPTETPTPPPVAETPPPEPDPVEQAIAEAAAAPEVAPAPKNVPVPADRPRPPTPPAPKVAEAKVAEEKPRTEKPKTAPKPEKQTEEAKTKTPEESEFDADQIAALLNRDKSAGGGAKRSTQSASLGGERTTGAKLSMSELDALRGQIQRCWSPPSGVSEAGSLRISIKMQLDPSGRLQAHPTIVDGGGSSLIARVAGEAALRAVQRCAPYNLPAEKYDTWADVVVNFDPSQMF